MMAIIAIIAFMFDKVKDRSLSWERLFLWGAIINGFEMRYSLRICLNLTH